MIVGIGIDSVEIKRFNHWHLYSYQQLHRIFSPQEIEYCLLHQVKSAERFAVRFAAKEAFFKAIYNIDEENSLSFLTICKAVQVYSHHSGRPELQVAWDVLKKKPLNSFISLTHTATLATAFVVLEKN